MESKLRTRRDNFAGVEGARQLQTDYEKELPDMLAFTAARLFERDGTLYDAFMRYLSSRDDERERDTFRLLLFYDDDVWSDQCLANIEEDEPAVSPLTVHAIRVTGLADLVTEIFGQMGVRVLDDEP